MNANTTNPTLERLDGAIKYYDKKSWRLQMKFKILKTIELIIAALIPSLAGFLEL